MLIKFMLTFIVIIAILTNCNISSKTDSSANINTNYELVSQITNMENPETVFYNCKYIYSLDSEIFLKDDIDYIEMFKKCGTHNKR
jgi:hypothetical protein